MSFTLSKSFNYNRRYPALNVELPGDSVVLDLTYTATGVNYGGRYVGDETEVVFHIACSDPVFSTNTVMQIVCTSTTIDEIFAQAEETLKLALDV